MFVAPIFVALVSGLTLWALTERLPETPITAPAATLEVVAFRVAEDPNGHPVLDISVRNTGDTVAVITGATFVVRDFAIIDLCEGGSAMGPSMNYPFVLPPAPARGATAQLAISQQVASDEADRFTIDLSTSSEEMETTQVRLYRFDVALAHDLEERPLAAGTAILALPAPPPGSGFLEPVPGSPDIPCYAENRATLRRFVELEGTVDPLLEASFQLP
jgi:hypothetical protein